MIKGVFNILAKYYHIIEVVIDNGGFHLINAGIAYGDIVFQLILLILLILLFVFISLFLMNYIIKGVKKNKQLDEMNRKLDELIKKSEKENMK